MAAIHKLGIQGVRSYPPEERAVIEFFTPLTVVVGSNGCGKTTIIECLKFACTGEFPPNTHSGQGFVHDPRVAKESEVKGSVRLLFTTADGKPVTAVRTMSLTQTRTKQQFKALDSAVTTKDAAGNKVSQSMKCSDIDRMVPQLLGISKPILENVIFCHQEESNWPLEAPATLKKKFDDIFASVRYTKALDTIRKLRIAQRQAIEVANTNLKHEEGYKEEARSMNEELHRLRAQLRAGTDRVRDIDADVETRQAQLRSLAQRVREIEGVNEELKQQQACRVTMERVLEQLQEQLGDEIDCTDEELTDRVQKFQASIEKARRGISDFEREIERLKARASEEQAERARLTELLGQHRAAADMHKTRVNERDSLIRDFSLESESLSQCLTSHASIGEDEVREFRERVETLLANKQTQLADLVAANKAAAAKVKAEFDDFKVKLQSARGVVAQKRSEQANARHSQETLGRKLAAITVEDRHVADLRESLAKEQEKLAALRDGGRPSAAGQRVSDLRAARSKVADQVGALLAQERSLTAHAETMAKLSVKKQELDARSKELDDTFAALAPELERFFADGSLPGGSSMTGGSQGLAPETLHDLLRDHRRAVGKAKDAYDEALMVAERSMSGLESLAESCQSAVDQKRTKINAVKATIARVCPAEEYEERVKGAEEAVVSAQQKVNANTYKTSFFKHLLKDAQEQHMCASCERAFGSDEERDVVVNRMQQELLALPNKIAKSERKLAAAREEQQRLRTLAPDLATVKRLEEELAEDEASLADATAKVHAQKEAVVRAREDAARARARIDALGQLQQKGDKVRQLLAAKRAAFQQYDAQKAQIARAGGDMEALPDLTLDEVRSKHGEAVRKGEELDAQIEDANAELARIQSEANDRELRCATLRQDLQSATAQLETKATLQAGIKEHRATVARLQEEIDTNENSVAPWMQAQERLGRDLARLAKEHGDAESAMSDEIQRHQRFHDKLDRVCADVDAYRAENKQEQLARTQQQLASSVERLNAIEMEHGTAESSRSAKEKMLRDREKLLENLMANVRARRQQRDLQDVVAKIEELEAQLRARESVVDLEQSQQQVTREMRALQDQRSKLVGSSGVVEKNVEDLERRLRQPKFRDANANYKRTVVEVMTTKMASEDLEKYRQALDQALMRYHGLKMEEINRIIRELWCTTYRGKDIDTIEIRADLPTESAAKRAKADAAGSTAKASYNYRVVMIKGDVVLDMRGRCSAGQKVLACLVIRLALAETFGLNCGLLALDEPTTNLDSENIHSLAAALNDIIENRRRQANFQLVVITHDEEFVQQLGRSEFCDYYYRVSKTGDAKSIIERHSMLAA